MSSMTPRMKTPFAYTLKNSLFGANTSRNVINGYCCSTNRENYCAEDAGQTLRHGRKTKEKIIANNEPLRKKNGDELKGGTLTRKIKQYKCDDKSQMVKNASAKLINEMIIDNKAKTIKTKKQRSNRKYRESEMKIDKIVLPKEEYLLIDDQFLVISNRMSTSQKLLSTFKSMCLDGAATKQIYQDNNRQQKLKLDKNKVNIFQQVKKQIFNSRRNSMAIVIQRWWRGIKESQKAAALILEKELIYFKEKRQEQQQDTEGQEWLEWSLWQEAKEELQCRELQGTQLVQQSKQDQTLKKGLIAYQCALQSDKNSALASTKQSDWFTFEQQQQNQLTTQSHCSQPKAVKIMTTKQQFPDDIQFYKLPQLQTIPEDNEEIFIGKCINTINVDEIMEEDSMSVLKLEMENVEKESQIEVEKSRQSTIIQKNKGAEGEVIDRYTKMQYAHQMIENRLGTQMGAIDFRANLAKNTFNTSIPAIHSFLVRFFKFYSYHFQDELLRNINTSYGHNIATRLRIAQDYPSPTDSYQGFDHNVYGLNYVIGQEAINEFFLRIGTSHGKELTASERTALELERVHQRALLDTFNEELNYFRPHCLQNGESYPWSYNIRSLTFYFVSEENFNQIFEHAELNTLKACASLCGLIVPNLKQQTRKSSWTMEETLVDYSRSSDQILVGVNEDRLTNTLHNEIKKQAAEWGNFEQQRTKTMLFLSYHLFEIMLQEVCCELQSLEILQRVQGWPTESLDYGQ